ncbi:hypothetical protein JW935_24355 [candidate division KSB1 bacterium]|nr:hypothetical protein [candidate division KSB1 bacterium]
MLRRACFLLVFVCLFLGGAKPVLSADSGIKVACTLSGKLLFSFGYTHAVAAGTALEVSVFTGISGKPFGLYLGALQDITPEKRWAPYAGLGLSVLVNRRGKQHYLPFVRATAGFAYRPHKKLSNNAEVWIAFLPASKKVRPVGIGIGHVAGF